MNFNKIRLIGSMTAEADKKNELSPKFMIFESIN
jgi:hypothetical protein